MLACSVVLFCPESARNKRCPKKGVDFSNVSHLYLFYFSLYLRLGLVAFMKSDSDHQNANPEVITDQP